MSEWQPIDTAPKDGSPVLLLVDYDETFFVGYWGLGKYDGRIKHYKERDGELTWRVKWDNYPFDANELTHWMKIPDLPEALP